MTSYEDDFEADDSTTNPTPRPVVVAATEGTTTTPTIQQQQQEQQPPKSSSSSSSSSSSGSSSHSHKNNQPLEPTTTVIETTTATTSQPQEVVTTTTTVEPVVNYSFMQHSSVAENNNNNTTTQPAAVPETAATTTSQGKEKENQQQQSHHPRQPIGFACPMCGSVIFGGARLLIASVVLPDCEDCKKLGYGEYFYHPPKINPEETRGALLKKKNMELLKIQIKEKEQRTLNHAKAQMLAMQEYISRQRREKCTRVHNNEAVPSEKQQQKENDQQQPPKKQQEEDSNKKTKENNKENNNNTRHHHASQDSVEGIQFDSKTVTTSNIHGCALAAANGDELRKTATDEASRLNITVPALLAIPGWVGVEGRRLGVKRVGHRYEIGFGYSATPLHFATLACRADLVATLLDLGADPNLAAGPSSIHQAANRTVLAPTCFEIAKANEFTAVLSLLEHSNKESAKSKFGQICEKKLAAAAERVRERNRIEGKSSSSAGFRKRSVSANKK